MSTQEHPIEKVPLSPLDIEAVRQRLAAHHHIDELCDTALMGFDAHQSALKNAEDTSASFAERDAVRTRTDKALSEQVIRDGLREDAHPGLFLGACVARAKGEKVSADILYENYEAWCRLCNLKPLDCSEFNEFVVGHGWADGRSTGGLLFYSDMSFSTASLGMASAAMPKEDPAERSTIARFLRECIERTPGEIITASSLYKIYKVWCLTRDLEPADSITFLCDVHEQYAYADDFAIPAVFINMLVSDEALGAVLDGANPPFADFFKMSPTFKVTMCGSDKPKLGDDSPWPCGVPRPVIKIDGKHYSRERSFALFDALLLRLRARPKTPAPKVPPERIVAAAIQQGGLVYSVSSRRYHHHTDVINGMALAGVVPITGEKGFLTSGGEFVGPGCAHTIAKKAGQLKSKTARAAGELRSEDLW